MRFEKQDRRPHVARDGQRGRSEEGSELPAGPRKSFFDAVNQKGSDMRDLACRGLLYQSTTGEITVGSNPQNGPKVTITVDIKANRDMVVHRRIYHDSSGKHLKRHDELELTSSDRDPATRTFTRIRIESEDHISGKKSFTIDNEGPDQVVDQSGVDFATKILKDASGDLKRLMRPEASDEFA